MVRNPGHFDIKHFANTTGARRQVVDALADRLGVRPGLRKHRVANVLAIVSHLVSQVKHLDNYTRRTNSLTPSTLKARDALVAAVEPDELLFATLPKAIGLRAVPTDTRTYLNANTYAEEVGDALDELTGCYDQLPPRTPRRTARGERRDQPACPSPARPQPSRTRSSTPPRERSSWSWRMTAVDTDTDWIKAVATVVAKKAPAEWIDKDRERFRRELRQQIDAFQRLVALHADHRAAGGGPFDALRVTITRSDGSEYVRLVGIDNDQRAVLERTLDDVLATLNETTGSPSRAHHALLALLGERLLPDRVATIEDETIIDLSEESTHHGLTAFATSAGSPAAKTPVRLRCTSGTKSRIWSTSSAIPAQSSPRPTNTSPSSRSSSVSRSPGSTQTAAFEHWFDVFRGTLPSPQMRWCTKNLKIKPIEEWIGDSPAISYVAIRADESNRKGYISTKSNIQTRFPFVEDGIAHDAVMRILEDAGIGLPEYYEWRTRSGCYFCFYQRKAEWIGLAERHPELFDRAVAIEQKVLRDAGVDGDADFTDQAMRSRQYTWSGGETLIQLRSRKDEILERHEAATARATKTRANLPLIEVLSEALDDDDDDTLPCTVCTL